MMELTRYGIDTIWKGGYRWDILGSRPKCPTDYATTHLLRQGEKIYSFPLTDNEKDIVIVNLKEYLHAGCGISTQEEGEIQATLSCDSPKQLEDVEANNTIPCVNYWHCYEEDTCWIHHYVNDLKNPRTSCGMNLDELAEDNPKKAWSYIRRFRPQTVSYNGMFNSSQITIGLFVEQHPKMLELETPIEMEDRMNERLFRQDNTEGYTDTELDELNTEWIEKARELYIDPYTEEYDVEAKRFADEVARRSGHGGKKENE